MKCGSPVSPTLMPKGYFREYWETLIMYSVTFSCVISSVYFTNAPLNRLKPPLSKPAASQMLEASHLDMPSMLFVKRSLSSLKELVKF